MEALSAQAPLLNAAVPKLFGPIIGPRMRQAMLESLRISSLKILPSKSVYAFKATRRMDPHIEVRSQN